LHSAEALLESREDSSRGNLRVNFRLTLEQGQPQGLIRLIGMTKGVA
jgi:hypothetical protein